MSKRLINGSDLAVMVLTGAECLQRNVERVNALNVFPVPDGDTGTNMNLTMASGVRELHNRPSLEVGKVAEALSKGLLMGARGNSGVILSQLFRGFAKSLVNQQQIDTVQFAAAMQNGVDMAYKAVVKPVEGTILTVAKEAAKHAVIYARRTNDIVELVREIYKKANEALQHTPELLPVLKQVGVVDSGGQGLVYIYEGYLRSLTNGDGTEGTEWLATKTPLPEQIIVPRKEDAKPRQSSSQSRLSTDEIEFLYDMEFFIDRKLSKTPSLKFDENLFKAMLARDGDSILVIVDDDIIKVHVHSRKPGDVLNFALPYGELTDLHILNMREQHRDIVDSDHGPNHTSDELIGRLDDSNVEASALGLAVTEVLTGTVADPSKAQQAHEWAPYGIIAVAMGEGISNIFLENNVDIVLSGGQTMNPSTENFVHAIESLHAEHIYVLPNNSNIILAAQQAAELCDRRVTVLSTRTIPQGLAALLAFRDEESAEVNAEAMEEAAKQVTSGQVTHAVRDTSIDGIEICEGDYIGILEKSIVASSSSLQHACRELLGHMLDSDRELVTVLTGDQVSEVETALLTEWVHENYPDVELEVHEGGQPLYPYLFAVE